MACLCRQSICVLFIYLICWTNLCLYVYLFFSTKMNYSSRISPSQIIDGVSSFCPAQVCSIHSKERIMSSMDLQECCGVCSCEDDCNPADSRCCFIQETEHVGEECLIPSTGVPDPIYMDKYIRYIMVSSCPASSNESMDYIDQSLNTSNSCHNKSVAPWGSLYPVYAHQTGTIYKNQECAVCNEEYNTSTWTPVLYCDLDYRKGDFFRRLDIDNYIQFYLGENIYDICFVNFIPPVSANILEKKQCYKHTVDTCAVDDFKIPDMLQLTTEEVVQACESNFIAPFASGFLYKNLFCFMCSGKNFQTSIRKNKCESFFLPFITRGLSSTFTLFINLRLLKSLPHISNKMRACNDNMSVCKEVYCPSARVRFEQGNCIFPTALWKFKIYKVLLKLTPSASTCGIKEVTINQYREITPWPKPWTLSRVGLHLFHNTSVVDHVFVQIEIKKTFQKPNRLLKIVAKYSSRPWCYNNYKGKKVCLSSDFLSYKFVLEKTILLKKNQKHIMFVPEYLKYPDQRSNASETHWLPLHTSIEQEGTRLIVGKMFFCDQIELDESEYTLLHETRVVYLIEKKQYLFDGEFVLIMTEDGTNRRIRICLEDSNVKIQSLKNVASIYKINFETERFILILAFILHTVF